MEVNTSPITAATSAGASVAPAAAEPVISSDFETFLKMLTAQARYQDPLEPMDSSEYSAQLAQFSMVEQQVLSNDLLQALTDQLGAGNMSQLAGWVGMEARTTAPVLFDGSPITVNPNPAAVADEVTLIVRNGAGDVVQRLAMPVSAEPVQWAGVNDQGIPFTAGLYSFDIESRKDGEIILSEQAETYARITEARLLEGETLLVIEGGSTILADGVTGLREPETGTGT